MGYIFVLAIGALLVLVIVVAAMRGSRHKGGKTLGGDDVTPRQPAGEEPTPGASSMAPQSRIENAQKRVPPA
jgi:hypothetical protein